MEEVGEEVKVAVEEMEVVKQTDAKMMPKTIMLTPRATHARRKRPFD